MFSVNAFLALVRAGLGGVFNDNENQNENLFEGLDWGEVQKLAEEQSVLGLVAAGLEKLPIGIIPLTEKLTLLGKCQLVEQRNKAMNQFVLGLVGRLQDAGIKVVLVKGQGLAQCYEKPLWRVAGDIDFLLDEENYQKAKVFLAPLATKVEVEDNDRLHQELKFEPWTVELHGTMHSGISKKVNSIVDEVQQDVFMNDGVRWWKNGDVNILLPNPNNDVILVFTHLIGHFYGIGIGLRQICDWCRLLWTFKDEIDCRLLKERLHNMGLITEWKGFAAFAVEYLDMPVDAMPFYENTSSYRRKAYRLCELILETGDLGHNKSEGYRGRYSKTISNIITFFRRFGEFTRIATIFPANSPKFFVNYTIDRIKAIG
jgi:hypothetical protein